MISQFFEVQIKEGFVGQYLDLADSLRPGLEASGGCLFIDRFKCLSRENMLLSYQIWQDEASMVAWRVDATHHKVQETGREKVFSDYRIRIAQVVYEAKPDQTVWQPERLTPYNNPARRRPTYVIATQSKNADLPVATQWKRNSFSSVYHEGNFAHLVNLPDYQSGLEFGESLFADPTTEHFRIFEVMRDYGMYDRAEAPQFYPPVSR